MSNASARATGRSQGGGGTLALFPGMAAAYPGMGRRLAGVAAAASVFARFSAASGVDVGAAACATANDELFRDRAWELAVVATEVAALEAWRAAGNRVSASLGFSIGAYAALLSAGALSTEQVVAMVDTVLNASRGLSGRFAMLAVTGMTEAAVEPLLRRGEFELAAVVAPGQLLLAGAARAVEEAVGALAPNALAVRVLAVRWPLHTSLMSGVGEELERSRARVGPLQPLAHPVYSGVDGGRIETPEEAWRLLVDHLHRPQRFDLAFAAARAAGAARVVEFGPTGTLRRAVRWLSRGKVAVTCFPEAPVARAARRR